MENVDKNILLMDSIPERMIGWEKDSESDLAVLLVPRFRRGPFHKWLMRHLRRPFMRVKLDEIGSFVWEHSDGKTPVRAICKAMSEHFGAKAEPAEPRVKLFFSSLYRSRFVRYLRPS